MYQTTRDSRPCECGGKVQGIPCVVLRHSNTKKHKTWEFHKHSHEFLALTEFKEKVSKLIVMRDIVRTGLVR